MEHNREFFFSFWTFFCPFTLPNNLKNQNFEKMKKMCGDITILHKCTIKKSYEIRFLRYGVRKTEVFVFLGHFCPITPLTTWKIKILKTLKNYLEIYTCTPYMTIIWYIVPDIWGAWDRIFCHFGSFIALLPLSGPEKSMFLTNEKKCLDILSIHTSVP